ncbi:hypothetical protein K488DRAFT_84909 [Vararia minispora EC-137]|uniref:Uncharacterized protein n=1 Tax=Vararia minispora EC-137 TaxID=1314806 RepID=A0ACB8QPA6_9AGAM|nr:hypothetical protein K488DRAFT_84909 [Vararia minispora EC-137]
MPNTVSSGTYVLTNVRYNNIVNLPDSSDGTPVSASIKSGKDLDKAGYFFDQGNGRYIIQNKGQKTYASVGNRQPVGATVVGRPGSQQYVIEETREQYKYTIATTDTGHYWGLPDSETGSAVELRASPTDKGNWWILTSA